VKWFASLALVLFLAAACNVEESRKTGENGLTVQVFSRHYGWRLWFTF